MIRHRFVPIRHNGKPHGLMHILHRPFLVVSYVMTDDANLSYGGYFERLYVIKDGLIEVVGGKSPYEYDVGVIRLNVICSLSMCYQSSSTP